MAEIFEFLRIQSIARNSRKGTKSTMNFTKTKQIKDITNNMSFGAVYFLAHDAHPSDSGAAETFYSRRTTFEFASTF